MMRELICTTAVAALAQWGSWARMQPRRPVGDENAYITGKDIFIRPPVMAWVGSACRHADARVTERRLRGTMAVASVLTVSLTTAAGVLALGPAAGLAAGLLLALHPERLVLGNHIWPDTLLGMTLAAVALVALLPLPPLLAFAALGFLVAFGTGTRIDFLVTLGPVMLAAATSAQAGWALGGAAGPVALLLSTLSFLNLKKHGLFLPDTTWAFNLMVMNTELDRDRKQPFALEALVRVAAQQWRPLRSREQVASGAREARRTLLRPGAWLRSTLRRLLTMLGPDTFITQKLFPPGPGYPELSASARKIWGAALRIASPLLVALVLAAATVQLSRAAWHPAAPRQGFGLSSPLAMVSSCTALLLLVPILFHARTRYRVTVLPGLCLLAALALAGPSSEIEQGVLLLAVALPILALLLLSAAHAGRELRAE